MQMRDKNSPKTKSINKMVMAFLTVWSAYQMTAPPPSLIGMQMYHIQFDWSQIQSDIQTFYIWNVFGGGFSDLSIK